MSIFFDGSVVSTADRPIFAVGRSKSTGLFEAQPEVAAGNLDILFLSDDRTLCVAESEWLNASEADNPGGGTEQHSPHSGLLTNHDER